MLIFSAYVSVVTLSDREKKSWKPWKKKTNLERKNSRNDRKKLCFFWKGKRKFVLWNLRCRPKKAEHSEREISFGKFFSEELLKMLFFEEKKQVAEIALSSWSFFLKKNSLTQDLTLGRPTFKKKGKLGLC